jgi:rhodanese-related sulfurtransferase
VTVASTVKEMLAAANACVPRISTDEARRLVREEGALLVDVRDAPELTAAGKLAGAVNVSRGMLEFRADGSTPYHDPEFQTDRPVILYCASGGRSCLSGKALQDLGYTRVYNLGGFKEAAEAGFPTQSS